MIKFQSTSDMFGKLQFGDKKDMPEDAKMKLKWKTIQFLLENKKQQIEALSDLISQKKMANVLQAVKSDKSGKKMQKYRDKQLKNFRHLLQEYEIEKGLDIHDASYEKSDSLIKILDAIIDFKKWMDK